MVHQADFKFFARLAALTKGGSGEDLAYFFQGHPAIKDAIEALGVPHTEVDQILVNGRPVDFSCPLQPGDQARIFPLAVDSGCSAALHLSPPPPEPCTFILDVHLGTLARRMRMLGFDCAYRNDFSDPQIIDLALSENRIILTRDRGILKHARVRHGYLVGFCKPQQQVIEVLERYRLRGQIRPLLRCPGCNGLLRGVDKARILHRLLPKTARYYDSFQECEDCSQLYWQGSHYAGIEEWTRGLVEDGPLDPAAG